MMAVCCSLSSLPINSVEVFLEFCSYFKAFLRYSTELISMNREVMEQFTLLVLEPSVWQQTTNNIYISIN